MLLGSIARALRPGRTAFSTPRFFAAQAPSIPLISRVVKPSHFFSSNLRFSSTVNASLPILTPPSVARWLMLSSGLCLAIVVVGGVTRLTESGLSITEWKPVTGVLPPLSESDWQVEFEKYKLTPEFKLLNSNMTIHDFKKIFYMEWGHRILGRLIGLTFVGPLCYFVVRKKVAKPIALRLSGLAVLIGLQGLMGWYMVKSGLEDSFMDTPGAVPRVSQYRLASHLALAFALYAGMFHAGMTAIKEWKFANGQLWSGVNDLTVMNSKLVRQFRLQARSLFGLVFITAMAGAFVAGLDAGLVYNEWPLMGGRLVPPADELVSPSYAKTLEKTDLWRNIFENPTTVQFNHRVLATTTYLATAVMFAQAMRPAIRNALPPLVKTNVIAAFGMVNIQFLLGIGTLLYLVPTPLAAAHQAGSLMLLTTVIQLLVSLRSPSQAARLWRMANLKRKP
ncbi:cytochrome oxidase assembly [Flagelloscypha sp. PMI_526]|nr:cytochrome oxidase assembly [Flagelloscypha sp. PMI_526]